MRGVFHYSWAYHQFSKDNYSEDYTRCKTSNEIIYKYKQKKTKTK